MRGSRGNDPDKACPDGTPHPSTLPALVRPAPGRDDLRRRSAGARPGALEAIDWYTGVAGSVDNDRARELLEEAIAGGGHSP